MRYFGAIGFESMRRDGSLYFPEYVERNYMGEVYNLSSARQSSFDGVNDGISLTQELSIVVDDYAHSHYQDIAYVVLNGVKWKVTTVTFNYPRLRLRLGEVFARYDGNTSKLGRQTEGDIVGA